MSNPENARAAEFLDDLSRRALDRYEQEDKLRDVMALLHPDDWAQELLDAAERQSVRDPEATSMRALFDRMAPELLRERLLG